MQKLAITESLFGELYPYIIDDNVTDIKWNGRTLWINDLNKGRYIAKDADGKPLKLADDWLNIFTTKVANTMNTNFNMSAPSMQAETDELRIHAVHKFVAGEGTYALAIRKTPSVSRLAKINLVKTGYVDEITNAIMPAMIRSRMSGCVIGDVGAGKTELEKYLCAFIPETDGIITVEDTLEMKLPKLYPNKDIYSLKVNDSYTSVDAIRDALRLLTKWLILSEARGREIVQVMEAASTGCVAMTSIHAENTWEIPDRMMNMAGDESREGFENDIYTFFDYAIKVKSEVTDHGIFRKVDQLSFFSRDNDKNTITIFYNDGMLTGNPLPKSILEKMKEQKSFLDIYYKYFSVDGKLDEAKYYSELEKNKVELTNSPLEKEMHRMEAESSDKGILRTNIFQEKMTSHNTEQAPKEPTLQEWSEGNEPKVEEDIFQPTNLEESKLSVSNGDFILDDIEG